MRTATYISHRGVPPGMWSNRGMRGLPTVKPGLGQWGGGLGDASPSLTNLLVNTSVQTGTAIGGALATSAIGTATVGATIGASLATAGIAVAGMAIIAWVSFMRRNGMQKENATKVADEAERLLKSNLDAWDASHKTVEDKEVALSNADAILQYMQSDRGCGNPQLGNPGERCINERLVRGARYPWLDWYRDPIANYTPTVSNAAAIDAAHAAGQAPVTTRTTVTDPVTGQVTYVETVAAPSLAGPAGIPPWVLLAGLGAVALMAVMD